MSLRINVRADIKKATAFYSELDKASIGRATANALNIMARDIRNESIEDVADVRRVKRSLVKSAIRITQRASNTVSRVIVEAFGGSIPLKEYSAKQDEIGVTVNVEGKSKRIPHAFGPGSSSKVTARTRYTKGGVSHSIVERSRRLAKVKQGDVYVRLGAARFPIKKLWGPSIPSGFIKRKVREAQERLIQYEWVALVNQKMEDQLAKLRAKYGG